jgi:hypothetical protein
MKALALALLAALSIAFYVTSLLTVGRVEQACRLALILCVMGTFLFSRYVRRGAAKKLHD